MKKQRLLSLVLALSSLISLLCACGSSQEDVLPETPGVQLWHAYNTENLMQDIAYPELAENRDYKLKMYGIRGDVESAQLMITPEKVVYDFEFEMQDLTGPEGAILSKDQFEVYAQWYVYVEGTYNSDSYYGYYPDALVPMMNMKQQDENRIEPGENQGIWLNLNIPEDAVAGQYSGNGILTLDSRTYEIPVEVTIYDATMPEVVHPRSCFLIWYDYMQRAEGKNSGAMAQAYFDLLVKKRCMPMYPEASITGNLDTFVQWVATEVMDNPKISTYALPYTKEKCDIGTVLGRDHAMTLLTKLAEKNIALRQAGDADANLFKKAYYYLGGIIDEPTGSMFAMVRACDLIITECKFAVADQYFKDYPDLYESLISLPHVVTTAYDETLVGSDTVGGVQAWCPQFQNWHSQEQREIYWERQASTERLGGEEAWWYGCNNPPAPFPTYHLDDDLIGSRVLSWMQYEYHCDGNLYWCINCNQEGCWEAASNIGGAVCEGNLTYPSVKFKTKGPLSTLRLESIREGQEDYEYFWMIEQAILAYNEKNGTTYNPDDLMAHLYDGLYDGMVPVRGNSELFLQRRLAVLELLQEITRNPEDAISRLANA